ncbi:MAG: type IX secretion system motor protein PorL/GldL [Chitinophagaceae bacterium]
MNFIFSFGAAVVILGALFKILHWRGATEMLMAGMGTEVFIFLLYSLIPPPTEYYWERFYPGIKDNPADEYERTGKLVVHPVTLNEDANNGNLALKHLDKMMQEAEITPTNLKKLNESFQKFQGTVSHMADLTEAVAATGDYTQKTREATAALGNMKEAYTSASSAMTAFNQASESTKPFHEQIQFMTRNLASLNAIYELELQGSNNHLKAMNHFYGNLVNASQSMADSAIDAKKTQEQIAVLAKNLVSLNAIYGNMLSAMQGK